MPKTRNFSAREKRDAMDLLQIHGDISTVHLLTGISQRTLRRWRKKLRRKNATLSEKSFSLSAKRTMSDKVPIIRQQNDNHMLTYEASNQAPADAKAASQDSEKAEDDLKRLHYIRDQLLQFSCKLAGDLDPDDPRCQSPHHVPSRVPSSASTGSTKTSTMAKTKRRPLTA